MQDVLWELPVPSTALVDGGPRFEKRLGREVAIGFSYESERAEVCNYAALVFREVEAFKCTFYGASDASMLEAYDRLLNQGETAWLSEVVGNLMRRGLKADGLIHLMIMFDDGPCYEVLCRGFRVEQGTGSA